MGLTSQQILAELAENNDFFDMIVDMIPSKLYIAGESGDDFNPKNRFFRGVTEGSKEQRKAAAKVAKRRKLDPNQVESTVDKKERLEEKKKRTASADMMAVTPADEDDTEPNTTSTTTTTTTTTASSSRIETLRAKLHAKIAAKQGLRPSNPDQISKRAARRADKQKRQEEAKRKKSSGSQVETAAAHYKLAEADPAADLANMDFGRLAGLNKKSNENYNASNKSLANLSKTKNLQKMLVDAQAKRQKLQELKSGDDDDKAQAAAMMWSETLKEADGQRVKDDPNKIKKALKRKATKKAKSQKAWKTRMEQTKSKKDERQKIRQHNLSARMEGGSTGANLSSKKIADNDKEAGDGGKRLSRAGFEGRKQEFLNRPKKSVQ